MSQLVKKENMTIVIREYQDNQGNNKKVYKTVGELITWRGDDGSAYQSWEMWGPTGSAQGKVFSQDNQSNQQQSGYQQQAQGQPMQQNMQPNGQSMTPQQVQQQGYYQQNHQS